MRHAVNRYDMGSNECPLPRSGALSMYALQLLFSIRAHDRSTDELVLSRPELEDEGALHLRVDREFTIECWEVREPEMS